MAKNQGKKPHNPQPLELGLHNPQELQTGTYISELCKIIQIAGDIFKIL
jgi:hypothetical protein